MTDPRSKRVLIVDDNVDLADLLSAIVREYGHDVSVAYGGSDGISLAASFLPDVVFLDLRMPGIGGYEVAMALRAMPALQRTRLVAMSGWDGSHSADAGNKIEFYRKLTKPVQMREVLDLIDSV